MFSTSWHIFKFSHYKQIAWYELSFKRSHQRCSVKIGVVRNFTKFTGKHVCESLFFNKVCNVIKKETWHTCFPVTFANFLSTPALDDCFYYFMTTGDLLVQKARILCLETSRKEEVWYFTHKSQNLLFSFVSNLFTSLNLHLLQCVNYVQFCSWAGFQTHPHPATPKFFSQPA